MAMDRTAFEALINRMETLAIRDPLAYRRRVFAWALLGYGYLLVVVLVLLAAFAGVVAGFMYLKALAVKLLLLVGGPLLLVLRSKECYLLKRCASNESGKTSASTARREAEWMVEFLRDWLKRV